MSNFLNLFSKIKKSSKKNISENSEAQKNLKLSNFECAVVHLDNTEFIFNLERQARGKVLEDYTYYQIEMVTDRNYFGLQYVDKNKIYHWLDGTKKIRKQIEIEPPYTFRIRVKFFSSDPSGKLQEYTRYLFVLQLKQMLRDGELLCEDMEKAADLSSLYLQGELGDFDSQEHTLKFISRYKFLPEFQQTEQFELTVLERYKLLKNKNLLPSICDRQYLEQCCSLPDYGVELYSIKGVDNKNYVLGLNPSGILIYEDNKKIGLFPWNKLTKLSFKKCHFKVVTEDKQDGTEIEHTFDFQCVDATSCKKIWKRCIENHVFYRLESSHKPLSKLQQVFRLKYRFNTSLRTEYQMALQNSFGIGSHHNFDKNEFERKRIQKNYRIKIREHNNNISIRNVNSDFKFQSKDHTAINLKRSETVPASKRMDVFPFLSDHNTRICSQELTVGKIGRQESLISSTSEYCTNVTNNE